MQQPRLAHRLAVRLVPGVRARDERDDALRQLAQARAERDRARARVEQLQGRVESRQQKVAQLKERVASLRLREDLGYVFVLTYGRSGSTLLQGILNSIPGYLVRGENRQALRHLYDYSRVTRKERKSQRRQRRKKDLEPTGNTAAHPFFGMDEFPVEGTRRGVRRLALDTLLRPEPDTRVTGFKEIRWEDEDVAEYVEWLREVFPGARFIVNTRDLDDVAKSKWWAEMPDAREHLEAVEARLLALAEDLGEAAHRVHYDDYVQDPDTLQALFAWLGEEYDAQRVREVLDTPHSY